MADVVITSPANTAEASTPKKTKKAAKSSRPKASHPPTAVMVTNAIKSLKERGGSSLQAIKKYISSTYKVDAEKLAPFIKKFIKASVASGGLVQTKGKGASGSFKLSSGTTSKVPSKPSVTKVAKKPPTKKPSKPRAKSVEKPAVAKKSPAKKAVKPKKAPAVEKKPAAPKPKAAKPKSPAKAKRAAKAPTKKPKSPKPKSTKPKAAAKAKKSPKKK